MMSAQSNNHELPAPSRGGVDIYAPKNSELGISPPETQPANNTEIEPQSSSVALPTQAPLAVQQPTVAQSNAASTTSANDFGLNAAANDVDVIEKVWVDKAKSVVGATRTNPSQQTIELAKVKSAYLKQRYGKEIKLPEEK